MSRPPTGDPAGHGGGSVREFLRARGCPARVVAGGLEGLIAEWERVAESVEQGYPLDTLDDYLNDMDGRELIEEALAAVPGARGGSLTAGDARAASLDVRLAAADARIRSALVPARACLWGETNAARHGWNTAREWWYFMKPARPGPGLGAELEGLERTP